MRGDARTAVPTPAVCTSRTAVGLGSRRLAIIDLAGGAPADLQRGRRRGGRLQRRDLQPPRAARASSRRAGTASARRCDTEVHRRTSTRSCGAGLRRAGSRHVRLRDLGRAPRGAWCCARDRRRQEAALSGRGAAARFAFASELYALLAGRRRSPRRLDAEAIEAYLALQYVPHPLSVGRGRAQAAARLARSCSSAAAAERVERYWQLELTCRSAASRAASSRRSCAPGSSAPPAPRLESDVPLGAFLSGGVDSSAVVAAMAQAASAACEDLLDRLRRRADTTSRATRACVAERFGTEHHELRRRAGRRRARAEHRAPPRRAVRRLLGAADASRLAELVSRARHGGADRRRRRRELRAATSATCPRRG